MNGRRGRMRCEGLLRIQAGLVLLAAAVTVASATLAAAQEAPVTLSASAAAAQVKPGGEFEVTLVARIAEGWHLYSLTQSPPPVATTIQLAPGQPFEISGEIEGPAPVLAEDPQSGETVEFYDGDASFLIPVKAGASAPEGKGTLRVQFRYQACNDSICLRPTTLTVDVPVQIGRDR